MYLYTFCGSPVRYLILRQVCRNKEIPEKFLKLPRFVRRYFFYILREHFPFLLWPNYLSPLLLIWLHTDCCLSAMGTEPASSLLHLSPPLHACPPIKISGCKQVIFFCGHLFHGSEDLGLNLSLSLTAQKISHLRHFKAKHLQSLAAGNCADLTFSGKAVSAVGPKDVGLDILTSHFTAAFTCCSQLRQIINSLEDLKQ